MNKNCTEIILSSDCHYDNLVAEIYIDGKYVALVSYDDKKNFFIETPSNELDNDCVSRKIPYELFVKLVGEAKKKLTKN